jgi:hypothetical protein
VTYSKSIQTSTVALDEDGPDMGVKGEAAGRETEDEMRKRILEELENERKEIEAELEEMRDEVVLTGEMARTETQRALTRIRIIKRTTAKHLCCPRLFLVSRRIRTDSAACSER